MCVWSGEEVHVCHCTSMEIRRQLVKVLSFYKMVPGTMLASRGLVPSPPGPSHSSLSILSQYCDQATTKENSEECICACSPRGLRVSRGREAWQPEHKLRVTSWVISMSTESNWNGVRLHTLEACLHDILPPTGDQMLSYVRLWRTPSNHHKHPQSSVSVCRLRHCLTRLFKRIWEARFINKITLCLISKVTLLGKIIC